MLSGPLLWKTSIRTFRSIRFGAVVPERVGPDVICPMTGTREPAWPQPYWIAHICQHPPLERNLMFREKYCDHINGLRRAKTK